MKKWTSLLLTILLVLGMSPWALAAEENVVGTVEDNVYTSEVFGFEMVLPDNWRFLSDTELCQNMDYDTAYGSREGLAALLEQESSVCAMFCTAEDDFFLSANLMVQDMGSDAYLEEGALLDLALDGLEDALKSQGFTDLEMTRETFRLADVDHAGIVLTYKMSGVQLYMIVVIVKGDQYMGSLTVGSITREKAESVLTFFRPLSQEDSALGRTKGLTYENKLLGISVTFDEKWIMLDEVDWAKQMGMTVETIQNEDLSKAVADALESGQSICDMSAQKKDGSGDNVLLILVNMGPLGVILDESTFYEYSREELITSMTSAGFEVESLDPETIDIGGASHQSVLLTCSGNGMHFYERQIYIKAGSYMGIVTIFSLDRDRLDAMTTLFQPC